MNGVTYTFTAAPVSAPAGMYTAELDGVRASWIVRPDGSVTGVQFNGGITGRDFEQAELQQLNTAQFQAQVRNKRILQQADQAVQLQNGTLTSKINGRTVTGYAGHGHHALRLIRAPSTRPRRPSPIRRAHPAGPFLLFQAELNPSAPRAHCVASRHRDRSRQARRRDHGGLADGESVACDSASGRLIRLASPLVLLALWQLGSALGLIPQDVLPAPSLIARGRRRADRERSTRRRAARYRASGWSRVCCSAV